jgi:hypothetical protein
MHFFSEFGFHSSNFNNSSTACFLYDHFFNSKTIIYSMALTIWSLGYGSYKSSSNKRIHDNSNFSFTHLICLKSDAFQCYCATEAFLCCSFGKLIVNVCVDGALKLTKGKMGEHFTKQGIVTQHTIPYAHQQAEKIE